MRLIEDPRGLVPPDATKQPEASAEICDVRKRHDDAPLRIKEIPERSQDAEGLGKMLEDVGQHDLIDGGHPGEGAFGEKRDDVALDDVKTARPSLRAGGRVGLDSRDPRALLVARQGREIAARATDVQQSCSRDDQV
jgi:hypothetical protein